MCKLFKVSSFFFFSLFLFLSSAFFSTPSFSHLPVSMLFKLFFCVLFSLNNIFPHPCHDAFSSSCVILLLFYHLYSLSLSSSFLSLLFYFRCRFCIFLFKHISCGTPIKMGLSVRPSVCLSVYPSVCLSVCPSVRCCACNFRTSKRV